MPRILVGERIRFKRDTSVFDGHEGVVMEVDSPEATDTIGYGTAAFDSEGRLDNVAVPCE